MLDVNKIKDALIGNFDLTHDINEVVDNYCDMYFTFEDVIGITVRINLSNEDEVYIICNTDNFEEYNYNADIMTPVLESIYKKTIAAIYLQKAI